MASQAAGATELPCLPYKGQGLLVLAKARLPDETAGMSPSAADEEPVRRAAGDGSAGARLSRLNLTVRVRRDDIALAVEVDGSKVIAEPCVSCPHGLVSMLGGSEERRIFTCDCGGKRCAAERITHTFNVARHGDELIWTRTNYPAGSSSVSFDHHQACVAVCQALLELKAAVDAHPEGIAGCAGMMPGRLSYEDLLNCIRQCQLMVTESAKG